MKTIIVVVELDFASNKYALFKKKKKKTRRTEEQNDEHQTRQKIMS